ncbi:YuzD family protein [Shouchella sp. JSM 1781072]|uniref:YuzD family protein n=1 Tax=Bacillaceae TaxID=186817 RepID=UPI000C086939|nr:MULTISPECIES: YuzD family protein [Bacillaceae]UTR05504.1 YuzD family protein [Alkalihalobacillus sp. LMS6]
MPKIEFTVYGAEQKCASCVHLPSALETKEWLEAALARKFPDEAMTFHYVDIQAPQTEQEREWSESILNEKFFYPLVLLNGEVIAEGNPQLKKVTQQVEAALVPQEKR